MFYPTSLFVSQEKILPENIIGQQPAARGKLLCGKLGIGRVQKGFERL